MSRDLVEPSWCRSSGVDKELLKRHGLTDDECGRYLGENSGQAEGWMRSSRGRGLDGEHGLHRGPRSPARAGGATRPGSGGAFKGEGEGHKRVTAGREALGRSSRCSLQVSMVTVRDSFRSWTKSVS